MSVLAWVRTVWPPAELRLPSARRALQIVALTIVIACAVLFVVVLWTESAHRR